MPSFVWALPRRTLHSQRRQSKTNSIAITSVPKSFFNPRTLEVLRNHFAIYGSINQWVPLPGFGRIIVVYYREEDAEEAKQKSDRVIAKADRSRAILHVYRADPNPIIETSSDSTIPEANFLRPPQLDANFLISPPGSPPVGWEPLKAVATNATVLPDDLAAALRRLQTSANINAVLLDPHEGSGVGVYVQHCDGDKEEEIPEEMWTYGQTAPARTKWRDTLTTMPPMRSVVVM